MATQITLIRHGEPTRQQSLLGSTDVELSRLGWKQLETVFQSTKPFNALVSSPLKRCKLFANDISKRLELPLTIENHFKECDFGEWDGLSYRDLHQLHPEPSFNFFKDPLNFPPPKGEHLIDFTQRVLTAWEKLIDRHNNKSIAVLTHAGVIRTIIGHCLKVNLESGAQFRNFAIDYASQSIVSVDHFESFEHFYCVRQLNKVFLDE